MSDRSNFITFHKKDFTIEQIKDSCEGFEIFICEVSNNENDHVNEYVFIYPEESEGKNYPKNSDDNNFARIISNKLQIPVLWIFYWEVSIYVSVHSNGKLDSFFERDYSDIIYDWWGITDEEEAERQLKAEEKKKGYLKREEVLNVLSLSKVFPKIDKNKTINIDPDDGSLVSPSNLGTALGSPDDLFYKCFG